MAVVVKLGDGFAAGAGVSVTRSGTGATCHSPQC